jgi:hypothetical protein
VVVIPHPCDALRRDTLKIKMLEIEMLRKSVDAIEVFNSRCIFNFFNKKAQRLATQLRKCGIAGSDAHTLHEIGNAYTIIECSDISEVAKILRNSPSLVSVHGKLSNRLVHVETIFRKVLKAKERLLSGRGFKASIAHALKHIKGTSELMGLDSYRSPLELKVRNHVALF